MKVKEIYEQLCLRVPVKQSDADPADFRGVLQRELKNYIFLVNHLKEENVLSDDIVNEVARACKKLNDIVTSVYQGLHSKAFAQLSNLLKGGSGKAALGYSIMICQLKAKEKPLYRMRRMDNRRDVSYRGNGGTGTCFR